MKQKFIALVLLSLINVASYADIQSVQEVFELDDITLAEQAYSTLSVEEKNSLEGQVLTGRLLLEKGDTEDGFDYFESLAKKYPDNVDANYYFGVSAVIMVQEVSIFSKLSYAKDFIKAMEKTVELKPDHLDALTTLIGFHLNAPGIAGGDTEKALVYAKQIKTFNAEQGYSQVANVYWKTEKPALAEKAIAEGLKQFPESSSLYFTQALADIKDEVWDKARANLTFAIDYAKDKDEKGRALYQQGKVAATSGEQAQLGIDALQKALPLSSKGQLSWVNYRLSQLYVQTNELKKASDLIAKIDVSEDDELKSNVKKLKRKLKKLQKT